MIRRKNGSWAKSDLEQGDAFASHLADIFVPNPTNTITEEITDFLGQPYQLDLQGYRSARS